MREAPGRAWFAFGVRLFAIALPLAALVAAFAPVAFIKWLGAIALVGSVLGLGLSLAGKRMGDGNSPQRSR